MTTTDDDHLAAELAQEAGQRLLALRAAGGDGDDLRKAGDRESHEFLAVQLAACRPGDAVLSEEGRDDPARLSAGRVWIVDPLDGTREFGEPGRTDWAVHVALWERGELTAGAVALPAQGQVLSTGKPPVAPPLASHMPQRLGRPPWIHAVASGRRRDGSQGGGGDDTGTIGDDDPGATGENATAFSLGWGCAARRPSGGRAAGWRSAGGALAAPHSAPVPPAPDVPGDAPARDPRGREAPEPSPGLRVVVSRTRPPAFLRRLADVMDVTLIPLGSAGAKAAAVIRGDADAYVHSGGQYEWDSAAPVVVARAAGLHTSRLDGSALAYNQPDPVLPDILICPVAVAGPLLEAIRAARR